MTVKEFLENETYKQVNGIYYQGFKISLEELKAKHLDKNGEIEEYVDYDGIDELGGRLIYIHITDFIVEG